MDANEHEFCACIDPNPDPDFGGDRLAARPLQVDSRPFAVLLFADGCVDGTGFQPLSFDVPPRPGASLALRSLAPGWYEVAPLALRATLHR